MQKILTAGALIAAVGVIGATASFAQSVRAAPQTAGPDRGYIDPYAAYAYTPGLRVEPTWEFSGSFVSKSGSLPYRELRVKPGGPVDSCFLNRLVPDRC
jgi:hypothetical protein